MSKHEHALTETTHGATWSWSCNVCGAKGSQGFSWYCAQCDYDECAACAADATRRAAVPTSIRALLEQLATTAETAMAKHEEQDATADVASSSDSSSSESSENESDEGERKNTHKKKRITKTKADAIAKDGVTGAATRAAGGPPADCLAEARELMTQLLLANLGAADLVALVALYAPFRLTEGLFVSVSISECLRVDLPLCFGRLAEEVESEEEESWTALVTDDWHDVLYAARGAEILVFDSLGHNEKRFAPEVDFVAPIRGLALSSFPHDVLCVLDAERLHVVGINDGASSVVDLRGKTVTCVCVDPVSGRVFVGSKGVILLLPSARELLEARGAVRWTWAIGLDSAHEICSIAFSPVKHSLHATTADGNLHSLLVSDRTIFDASKACKKGKTGSFLVCEVLDVTTASKGGLCLEVRSGHLFSCGAFAITEIHACVVARISSPSICEHSLCAIAINERRRILYVSSARQIEAFEVTSHAWRLTESFVSDCAALAPVLSADIGIAQRTVGVGSALLSMLTEEALLGVGATTANLDLVHWRRCSLRRARKLRDQAGLGQFYAVKLNENNARGRACARALAATPWFDEYARVESASGLQARYLLRAFDRGMLWALTSAARVAIEVGSAVVRVEAMRLLRATHTRGDMVASEVLAQHMLVSRSEDVRAAGFSIMLGLAEVCFLCHRLVDAASCSHR